jgi:RHS repeat-associated protein
MRTRMIGLALCIAGSAVSAAAERGSENSSPPATATITVTGSEQQVSGAWDTASITISFNGYTETVNPGQYSTSASIASAFAAKFSRDDTSKGLSAQVICGSSSSLITLSLATGTYGPLSVTGSTTSFKMTPVGFAQITDSGTVTLTVNGILAASTNYGAGATQTTIAQGLSGGVISGSPVTVSAAGNQLKLQANTAGAATDYTYSVQTTNYDSTDFSQPSFVYPPLTGTLTGGADATSGASATVYSYSITQPGGASGYDAVGNVTNYTDSVRGTWAFGYDTLNRLTAGAGTPAISNSTSYYCWAYDSFGNRLTQSESNQQFQIGTSTPCQAPNSASLTTDTATYSTSNQMLSTNASGVLAYLPLPDAAGDVTNDGINQYAYDPEGRICAVETAPLSGGILLEQYLYNAEGQRVAKGTIQLVTVNGQPTLSCDTTLNQFVLTNQYLLGPSGEQETELNASGALVHTNVYAGGSLLATYDNTGNLHYHLSDWLGTRRVQTTSAGAMEQTWFSLPFGDGLTPSALGVTEQHYTGKERDTESGLDYFGARYYGSSMGRMMSPDPGWFEQADATNPQTWNQYAYVLNNPLTNTDPTGRSCQAGSVQNDDGTSSTVYSDDGDGEGCKAAGIAPDGTDEDPDVVNVNSDGSHSEMTTARFDPFEYFGQVAAAQWQATSNNMNATPTPMQYMKAIKDATAKIPNVCAIGGAAYLGVGGRGGLGLSADTKNGVQFAGSASLAPGGSGVSFGGSSGNVNYAVPIPDTSFQVYVGTHNGDPNQLQSVGVGTATKSPLNVSVYADISTFGDPNCK